MKTVIIVKDLELGWDNIVGVFDADVITIESLQQTFPDKEYIIQDYSVEQCVDNYV